ncbi:hypothetical protein ACFLQK_01230 [bacterium]
MKKLYAISFLFLLLAAAAAAEPVELRYRFTPGDHMEYIMTVGGEGEIEMVMTGAAKKEIPVDMDILMRLSTDVKSVDDDGLALLESTITRYLISQGGEPMMDYSADKDPDDEATAEMMKLFAEPLVMKVDDRGGVKEVSGMEKLAEISPQFDIAELLSRMQQPFPDHPVEIGETWTQSAAIGGGGAGSEEQEITSNFEFVGYETVKDLNCVKIKTSFIGDMSGIMESMISQFPMAKNAQVEYLMMNLSGHMFFQPDAGILIAMEFNMKQDMAMTVDIALGKEAKTMKMKMTMNMEGVYELE